VLCSCQSTRQVAQQGEGTLQEEMLADTPTPPRAPVRQVQYVSQEWIDQAPSEPYHGYVPPCSCCGPGSGHNAMGCPPAGAGPAGALVGPTDEYLCDGG